MYENCMTGKLVSQCITLDYEIFQARNTYLLNFFHQRPSQYHYHVRESVSAGFVFSKTPEKTDILDDSNVSIPCSAI